MKKSIEQVWEEMQQKRIEESQKEEQLEKERRAKAEELRRRNLEIRKMYERINIQNRNSSPSTSDFGVFEISNSQLEQLFSQSIQSFTALEDNTEVEYWQEDGLRIKRVFSTGESVTAPITDMIVLSGSVRVAKGAPTTKSAFFTCIIDSTTNLSQIEGSNVGEPEPLEIFKYKLSTGEYVGRQLVSLTTHTITLPTAERHILRMLPLDRSKEVQPRFNNRPALSVILNWGQIVWTNIETAFRGSYTLDISAEDIPILKTNSLLGIFQSDTSTLTRKLINKNNSIGKWDVSGITSLVSVFRFVEMDSKIDLSEWDVSNVTNMADMFRNSNFNGNISSWDVSNVTNMVNMFRNSNFNGNISSWDVSNVISMASMFRNSNFNGYINNWDVSNVISMAYMFLNTPFNQPLNQWNVSSLTNMEGMFRESPFNGRIGNWDVSNVTNMSQAFLFTPFNQDITKWDTSSVTNMDFMFFGASKFNQDLSSWCVENISTQSSGFDDGATKWTKPRPNWGQPC